jgi:signal transduction histidine kinase
MKLSVQILLAFAVVITLSVIDTYSNYRLSLKVQENSAFLIKSEAVIRNSARLHKTMIEMQSGYRGYLLTSDEAFLYPYLDGLKTVPELMEEQKALVRENSNQLFTLDLISILHKQWVDYSDSLITAKREAEDSSTTSVAGRNFSSDRYDFLMQILLKRHVGKTLNDAITKQFLEFDRSEYKLRNERSEVLLASIRTTHTVSFIFFLLTLAAGIITTWYIIRLIVSRIRRMSKLAENISKGNFETIVDRKKDELTALSFSLNAMSRKLKENITELERRNEELNRFAYVVSHDLKAPLRGIYNVIQWIEEDLGSELSPQMRKYLAYIPQRTKKMEELINAILDYTRIKEKTPPEDVDVHMMVKDIVESIVPRNFEVELMNLPKLYTERIKLEQVFMNLISNSVKYCINERPSIKISCINLTDSYQFSVKDNGIGIDSEYHKKIFEIFQTLREKDDKESTGIGLAIIKRIVEEQNGFILVNSEAGKGAEFIFTWPKHTGKIERNEREIEEIKTTIKEKV